MVSVFISYTHDSEEHMQRVGQLSDKLRRSGVDCEIDQYEMSPAGGWAQWSEQRIEEADFVLVVCTETYRRRLLGEEGKGKGLGGRWEGWIIRQEIYDTAAQTEKFVPILVSADDEKNIPAPLRGRTYFMPFDSEDAFIGLYRLITNQPKKEKPKLGETVALPGKDRWQSPPRAPGRRRTWYAAVGAVALAAVLVGAIGVCASAGCFGDGPPPPETTPAHGGAVRAEVRVFPVMPWALKPMVASNPSLYWLLLHVENQGDRPAHLDVKCEVLNEPPVAACATLPWSISLSPGETKDEKIDPRLRFLNDAGPDTAIDLQLTWRVTDDRGIEVEGGRQTVTIKIPPRNAFFWDLKDAAGREIPKEFLVASLAAWTRTVERNPIYEEGKRLRDGCASMTAFLDRVYSELLRNADRLAISPGVPPLPPMNASVELKTPREVLDLKRANPVEAALLVAALAQEPAEWYGMRLAGASVRRAPGSDPRILILWTDPAGRWNAVDLTKTDVPFDENRRLSDGVLEPWFESDVLPALEERGVYVNPNPRRMFLEFSKAAVKYGIQPFPQTDR